MEPVLFNMPVSQAKNFRCCGKTLGSVAGEGRVSQLMKNGV